MHNPPKFRIIDNEKPPRELTQMRLFMHFGREHWVSRWSMVATLNTQLTQTDDGGGKWRIRRIA